MEKITLKNSNLEVSRLCFGGCPMGRHGWGNVSKEELIKAVRKAVDLGVNFFDTADVYGLGESEKILGEALGNKKNEVIIATKFGVRVENGKTFYDNSPEWIVKALEQSLKRLKRDYIDLYQIHYRDGKTPIGVVVETLEKLKKQGYIRYFGLSNIYLKDIEELKDYKDKFVSFQNEFSLARRDYEKDIISISKELEITPLTWGSLGQGILTGKYDANTKFGPDDRRSRKTYINFHGDKLIHNLKIVEKLKKISKEINKPVPSIAIRWILDYLPNSVVLVGIKNVEQLKSNLNAFGWKLSNEYIQELEKISRYGGDNIE
jgi:aryl-alcohol dehydrogenase-like predicted oxidoreductase